jgi:GH24 family phage-related lysozyme (muramidase)
MAQVNAAGLSLIENFEGLRLTAYPDPGTGGAPWTVGFGHTGSCEAIGIDHAVEQGMTITQEQADKLLAADLEVFENGVNELVARNLTPNQFSALVSFAYNVGLGNLADSTLLRLVNAGNFKEAAAQFSHWVYADGVVLPGLVRRRAAEAALFLQPG